MEYYDPRSYVDGVAMEDLENSLEELKQHSIDDNHKQYLRALLRLAHYHMDYDHRDKARKYVKMSIALCLPTSVDPLNAVVMVLPDVKDRYEVCDIAYQQWKNEGYVPSAKDKIRINFSVERNRLLASIVRVLETVLEEIRPAMAPIIEIETTKNPSEIDWRTPLPQPGDIPVVVEVAPVDPMVDIVKFRLATAKESSGALQEALALYSELIVAQTEHVSLDVVIFRAALLLKHIGSTAQAMEYFEFLTDEPPVEGGYTKLHLLSLLGLVYEESSDKYSLVMKEIFTQVIPLYVAEITKMGNIGEKRSFSPDRKQRPSLDGRLTRSNDEPRYDNSEDTGPVQPDANELLLTLTPKTMMTSSELWEMLGLQAIHACDYLMAAEMLAKAVSVSIVKRRLLHATAEVYYMLGQTKRALPLAEKCLSMQPHSAVLRNFVLVLDPEKYAERLREMTLSDATKPKTSILKGSKDMNKEKKLINADKEQISRLIKALDSDEEVWDAVGGYNPNLSIDGLVPEGNEAAALFGDEGGVGGASSTSAEAKMSMGSPTPQAHPSSSSSDSPGWLAKVANRTAAALKGGAETSKTLFSAITAGTLNGGVSMGSEESLETRANRQGRKDLAGLLEQQQQQQQQQQQRRSQSPQKGQIKGKDVTSKGIAGGGAGPPRPLSPPLSPPLHPLLIGKTKLNPLGSDHVTGKPDNVGSKPEKPKVSKETRNMVHNLLSGNQNVHYYDPNLRFLAEQKSKASNFNQYKTL